MKSFAVFRGAERQHLTVFGVYLHAEKKHDAVAAGERFEFGRMPDMVVLGYADAVEAGGGSALNKRFGGEHAAVGTPGRVHVQVNFQGTILRVWHLK
jgi:hypothetical protein